MKTVNIETRISIRGMLKSSDKETRTLGWIMFIDEYQEEIINRLKTERFPYLTNLIEAIEFLNRSIAQSKRRL